MRDIVNNVSVAQTLAPAARTATANGSGVDLRGFDAALALIETGVITDGTHTIQVEESDDNSTFTAVASADLDGAEPVIAAADDNKLYEIGYRGTKRYIRVISTVAGTTTGGIYGAVIVRGRPHLAPA